MKLEQTYKVDRLCGTVTYTHTATIEGRMLVAERVVDERYRPSLREPIEYIDQELRSTVMRHIESELYGAKR